MHISSCQNHLARIVLQSTPPLLLLLSVTSHLKLNPGDTRLPAPVAIRRIPVDQAENGGRSSRSPPPSSSPPSRSLSRISGFFALMPTRSLVTDPCFLREGARQIPPLSGIWSCSRGDNPGLGDIEGCEERLLFDKRFPAMHGLNGTFKKILKAAQELILVSVFGHCCESKINK